MRSMVTLWSATLNMENASFSHNFRIQVFTNDFPALLPPPGPTDPVSSHPLLQATAVQGGCDVIVFHPRHDLTLARMKTEDIESVINEWIRVYLERGKQPGIKYVQIFEVRIFSGIRAILTLVKLIE